MLDRLVHAYRTIEHDAALGIVGRSLERDLTEPYMFAPYFLVPFGLAIAGLLEDNYKGTNVGDLPFLAKIFGRRNATRNETELIILVTPELVHPMEPEEVPPLPGFDVTEPTNAEFFLCGDIEGYPTREYRSTVWPRLKKRYGGPAMTSGPFGHGQ